MFGVETVSCVSCWKRFRSFFLVKRFETFRDKTVSYVWNRFETFVAEAVSYSFHAQTISKRFVVRHVFDVSCRVHFGRFIFKPFQNVSFVLRIFRTYRVETVSKRFVVRSFLRCFDRVKSFPNGRSESVSNRFVPRPFRTFYFQPISERFVLRVFRTFSCWDRFETFRVDTIW